MSPKATLRQEIRARLHRIPEADRATRSLRLCQRLMTLPEWAQARRIGCFSALPDEPDLSLLLPSNGQRLCYPKITGDELTFLEVRGPGDLERSRWNLLEPCYRAEAVVPPEEIDLLFVPGVAFTRDGHRMGRGRGYYDRLMATQGFRAKTVGICFREQVVDALPLEPHDLAVGCVVDG